MPVRIFGPARSTSTASGRFIFSAAARARAMSFAFSSCVPCDMLTRTPSMPAASIASISFGSREAGPRVARIFALLIDLVVSGKSKQKRYHRRHAPRVSIEFRAERSPQELLFAAHANYGPNCVHDDRNQQPNPVADS